MQVTQITKFNELKAQLSYEVRLPLRFSEGALTHVQLLKHNKVILLLP